MLSELVPDADALSSSVDIEDAMRDEWFAKRRGKFTCSRFGDLMSSGRKKEDAFSVTGWNYIYQVAAERLGSYSFPFDSAPTRWGKEHEQFAIDAYCFGTGVDAGSVITGTDCYCEFHDWIGGTPDGLIDSDGCIEVKCPYTPEEHMRNVHQKIVPDKYFWQVVGHLLVAGRNWCDFVSFDPRIEGTKKLMVVRVNRDDVATRINALEQKLLLAVDEALGVISDE